MRYFLPAVFGFATGIGCGFFLVYLLDNTFKSLASQIIAGIIVGGISGWIIGSVSGEANASTDAGSHRILVAVIFGAIGGALGATKLDVLWQSFRSMGWMPPISPN